MKAYVWISKAANQGLPIAQAAKVDLAQILTPAELGLVQMGGIKRPDLSGPVIDMPEFKPIP